MYCECVFWWNCGDMHSFIYAGWKKKLLKMCAGVSGGQELRQRINNITNRLFAMAKETETGPMYR